MPPFHHMGPKDPMKSKRQSLSQSNRTSHFIEEKLQAQEEDSIKPSKGKGSNESISLLCQNQDVSTHPVDGGPSASPAGGGELAHGDETRSNDVNTKPDHTTAKHIPLDPVGGGGDFKDKPQTSTYLELCEKSRKAHYLRHRIPPESERLLSTGQIFGHKESSQSRAEEGCENRVNI